MRKSKIVPAGVEHARAWTTGKCPLWVESDVIYGDSGDDYVDGSDGNDVLIGGTGADILYGFGQPHSDLITDRDTFLYQSISGSVLGSADEIRDFHSGGRSIHAKAAVNLSTAPRCSGDYSGQCPAVAADGPAKS